MNYIKHLNNILAALSKDPRVTATHFTLYMALFQTWNENRFQNPISIVRAEVMDAAKISSFTTYTRNLRQLHEWRFIEYIPSNNPSLGTRVNMYDFCNGYCNGECNGDCKGQCNTSVTPSVTLPPSTPYINKYKQDKEIKQENQPTLDDVLFFFKEKKYPEEEAKKYYNHYQACGWLMGGKTPIKDWKAAAEKWITNSPKFNQQANGSKPKPNNNAGTIKDYSEPL